jgi:hypothetical protein
MRLRARTPGQRSGPAGDVYDPGLRGPAQRRQKSVGDRDDPEQICFIRATEAVDVRFDRWLAIDHDAGVVDQDVQVRDLLCGVGDALVIGDVEKQQPGVAADLIDGRRRWRCGSRRSG